jgi:hypothetical protein
MTKVQIIGIDEGGFAATGELNQFHSLERENDVFGQYLVDVDIRGISVRLR